MVEKGVKVKRFSDFSEEAPRLDGEKIDINEIFDKEIIILNYRIRDSKHNDGTYITLQFTLKEKKYVTFTASNVLQNQMVKYGDNMPFHTTIIREGRYYTLS